MELSELEMKKPGTQQIQSPVRSELGKQKWETEAQEGGREIPFVTLLWKENSASESPDLVI